MCAAVVLGDSRDRETHREAARTARDLAPLAGWVNNAGITVRTPLHALADPERAAQVEQDARDVVEINGLGYLWGCAAAVEAFTDQVSGGSIVNIGSIHGRAAFADHAAYELTKGGIDALARSVAVTYGRYGVRANTVAPGGVRTPHLDAQIARAADPAAEERALAEGPPLGRIAESRRSPPSSRSCCPTRRAMSPASRSPPTAPGPRRSATRPTTPTSTRATASPEARRIGRATDLSRPGRGRSADRRVDGRS